jgi:hypothetical protein
MATTHYFLHGILCDVMVPEGTPAFGAGDFWTVDLTEPENKDDNYFCVFNFDTEAKLFAHEQQILQIKYAAADANQQRLAARINAPKILFWINFLVLVRQFKDKWGTEYVPKDIRDATTDVETMHGIALTFPN